MNVLYRKSFFSDLDKINNIKFVADTEFITELVNSCQTPEQIPGFKYLRQYPGKGRIELAPFRIGVEISDNTIIFIRILHRNDIYNQFP
jgi:mRNA interferase RelE/StbE